MKSKTLTRNALLTSIISLLLCISMLVGTTFAWFTDSVKSGINTIAAGVLDVEMEYLTDGQWKKVDETTKLFDENALWEPGHTEVAYLRISNAGDLALKYQLGMNIAGQTGSINKAGESFMLSDHIVFGVLEDVQTPYATRAEARAAVTAPAPLTAGYAQQQPLLPGDEPDYVALVVFMPETVGNEANYATGQNPPKIELGIKLTAAQQLHESDSFGNDYDIFAEFPKGTLDISVAAPVVKAEDGTVTAAVNMGGAGTGVSAAVPQGVAMADDAAALSLTVKTMAESGANITLSDDQISASVDVHMDGVAEGNTVPMIITLERYLPGGINTGALELYHVENGTPVAMTQVADPVNHNEFSYDPLTGTVKLALASFSEVAVIADTNNPWDGETETAYTGSGTEADPYLIANADQLAYFRTQVDNGNTFEGKFVKLANTIQLSGKNFDPIGWGYDYDGYTPNGKTFNGTFDGNHQSVLGLKQDGWELETATGTDYSNSMAGAGLFASAVDATFKNIHISGADIRMDCVDMGILVGYAQGNCVFDHIRIYNSKIANYQRATGGVIGEVSPKRGADGKPVSSINCHTIKDVVIGNNVVVGTMWGDFDAACGGIIGARWDDDNATQVHMEDVTVGCRLDVYNDITAAYRWHAYRRAGMLIGNTDIPAADGRTAQWAKAPFLTCTNVVVELGDWTEYHYCEFTNDNNPGKNYPWVRVELGENNPAYSNPRYGHPVDVDGKNVTNDIHTHQAGEECHMKIPFGQLYGGGQGVYGATEHPGVTIARPIYTVAYMNGTEVLEVEYVVDNKMPHPLKPTTDFFADQENLQWIDREGKPITEIPTGNTQNKVVHLDRTDKWIAYFVDINGMEIYSEEFSAEKRYLDYIPPVPHIQDYTGRWEHYDLTTATASIVIKPIYSVDTAFEDLYKMNIDELFEWISQGETVVMSQELTGEQGNASKTECCTVTENTVDTEARLNLNGYTLHYTFNSNANQSWLIFDIQGGSTLTISGGINHSGKLIMELGKLNSNAKPVLFDMDPGAKLVLEKGTTIEFHYPAGCGDQVSMFGVRGEQFGIDKENYPYLEYTHDTTNNLKRVVVKETTVIEIPAATATAN